MAEQWSPSSPSIAMGEEGGAIYLVLTSTPQRDALEGDGAAGTTRISDSKYRYRRDGAGDGAPLVWDVDISVHERGKKVPLPRTTVRRCVFKPLKNRPTAARVTMEIVTPNEHRFDVEFVHTFTHKVGEKVDNAVYEAREVPEPFGLAIRCTELLPSEEPAVTFLRRLARHQQQPPVADQNGGHAAVVVAGRIPPGIITEKLGDLGRGSFGVVIKAKTTCERGLPAVVAVKQMHVSHGPKAAPTDIDDEAAVIAAIPAHPNVVKLYGWGQLFGKPSLVFELCEEGDLHSYLKSNTRAGVRSVPPVTVLDLSQQIATGMKHIHANRLYHRDLKPNNVLLSRKGVVGPSGLRAVITDLGLAKNVGTENNLSASVAGSQVGTYIYMAPETIAKSVFSQGTDVWSYASIVWELLTGQAPYSYLGAYNPVAVAFQVGFGTLVPEQLAWPQPFDVILTKCLSKDHHERPTFTDILAHLAETDSHRFAEMTPSAFYKLQKLYAAELRAKFGSVDPAAATSVRLTAAAAAVSGVEAKSPAVVVGTPQSDVGSLLYGGSNSPRTITRMPSFGMGGGFDPPATPIANPADFPGVVRAILGGVCDYADILAEYGFGDMGDFQLYSEKDLVDMGFKKVHARKLLRAAGGSSDGSGGSGEVTDLSGALRAVALAQ